MGGCALPPPTQRGDRIDPARARPVPFCFQGLRPPPRTAALFLAAPDPALALACCQRTTRWSRSERTGAPNTSEGRSALPTRAPVAPSTRATATVEEGDVSASAADAARPRVESQTGGARAVGVGAARGSAVRRAAAAADAAPPPRRARARAEAAARAAIWRRGGGGVWGRGRSGPTVTLLLSFFAAPPTASLSPLPPLHTRHGYVPDGPRTRAPGEGQAAAPQGAPRARRGFSRRPDRPAGCEALPFFGASTPLLPRLHAHADSERRAVPRAARRGRARGKGGARGVGNWRPGTTEAASPAPRAALSPLPSPPQQRPQRPAAAWGGPGSGDVRQREGQPRRRERRPLTPPPLFPPSPPLPPAPQAKCTAPSPAPARCAARRPRWPKPTRRSCPR